MNTADIEDSSVVPPPAARTKQGKSSDGETSSKKMPDINDLLSGIMYRMRKVEYTPDHDKDLPPIPVHVRSEPEPPETSFYYKESSLTTTSSEDQIASIGDVHKETVEVAIEKAIEQAPSELDSSSSDGGGGDEDGSGGGGDGSGNSSSSEDQVSQAGSYVSKISQKVFVHQDPEMQKAIAAISLRPPAVPPKMSSSTASSSLRGGPPGCPPAIPGSGSGGGGGGGLASTPNFQGELKEKCMTFFSSVTRSKREMDLGLDNPTYAHSRNSNTKL